MEHLLCTRHVAEERAGKTQPIFKETANSEVAKMDLLSK